MVSFGAIVRLILNNRKKSLSIFYSPCKGISEQADWELEVDDVMINI